MMTKRILALGVRALALATFLGGGTSVGGLGLVRPPLADADATVQRPISDFLDAQGSAITFTPPVPDQLGWASAFNEPPVRFVLVDYTGLAAKYLQTQGISLGTTTDGKVTERPLADGRAEVTVILHTDNALTWVTTLDLPPTLPQFNNNPLLFGSRAQDIVANPVHNKPALGASDLYVVFINTAPGAPLPDLTSGVALKVLSFRATAKGPLHALAGLGPEGTPGRAIVTQICLYGIGSGKGALADGCPVERVELRAIGR